MLYLANQALASRATTTSGSTTSGVIHYARALLRDPGPREPPDPLRRRATGTCSSSRCSTTAPGPAPGRISPTGCSRRCSASSSPRASLRPAGGRALASFTNRLALLLVPALAIVVVWRPDQRIASPNLDFAAFVLVAVGMLYLAEAVERGFQSDRRRHVRRDARRRLGDAAAVLARRRSSPSPSLRRRRHESSPAHGRRLGGSSCRPRPRLRGWPARPSSRAIRSSRRRPSGSVDWRVPLASSAPRTTGITPGRAGPATSPSVVLGSWHWLQRVLASSTPRRTRTSRCRCSSWPCLPPALLPRGATPAARPARAPMLAVVVPSLVTLVGWFSIAPDPRFVWAPIWLVPFALAAWAIPDLKARPSPWLLVPAGIARCSSSSSRNALRRRVRAGSSRPSLAQSWSRRSIAVALHAGAASALGRARGHGRRPDRRRRRRLGRSRPRPAPRDARRPARDTARSDARAVEVRSSAGLVVHAAGRGRRPVLAGVLCVPQLEVTALAMRGSSIADGFRAAHTEATTSGGAG